MKRSIRFIIAGAVILALGQALGGSLRPGSGAVANAQGESDGQIRPMPDASMRGEVAAAAAPSGGATAYRTYWGNEFLSTHSNLTYASSGPAIYALALQGSFAFKLPVDLPNGSEVNSITIYLVDNSAGNNMTIRFYSIYPTTSTQYELTSASTAGLPTNPGVQTVTMSGAPITIIDTVNYAYALVYEPVITGSLHQMVGARIQYIPPSIFGVALPTILKNNP